MFENTNTVYLAKYIIENQHTGLSFDVSYDFMTKYKVLILTTAMAPQNTYRHDRLYQPITTAIKTSPILILERLGKQYAGIVSNGHDGIFEAYHALCGNRKYIMFSYMFEKQNE